MSRAIASFLDTASSVIAGAVVLTVMAGVGLFCVLLAAIFAPAHFAGGAHRTESPGPSWEWYGYAAVLVASIVASAFWPGVWGA